MNSKVAATVLGAVTIGVSTYAFMEHKGAVYLEAQLATAGPAAAAPARAQANASQAQVSTKQQQLQMTVDTLAADTRADLPVSVSFRRGILPTRMVGIFRNTSRARLEFTLDLETPVTGRHIRKVVVLNPNGTFELESVAGWGFAPGLHIILSNPAFRAMVRTVGPDAATPL